MGGVSMRIFLVLAAIGCTRQGTDKLRVEPTFVTVTLSGDMGSQETPRLFTTEPQNWPVLVQTLDKDGDPYDFDGDLKIKVRPGDLDMDPWVTLTDGEWSGEVLFHAGFGPTRIWFSDEGDKNSGTGREPSWAAGVSETIWYARPTIAEMQKNDDVETNNLEGEFAELRISDRQVVVTALGTTGFWVTDIADTIGSYNSLFVYTFNEPRDVAVGDQLAELAGGNNEYLGATQLSWPTWELVEGGTLTPPDPVTLDAATACDDAKMEGLEAALVEIPDATIPSSFVEGSEDYTDWQEYGQWPVTLEDGACTVYVSAETVAPDFSPAAHTGENLGTVRGMVTQIWDSWIVLPRSADDLGAGAAARPSTPAARPARPTRAPLHTHGPEPMRSK